MMVHIEDQYFHLNRMLFHLVGAWHSKASIFALLYRIICYGILITFIIAQLMTFVISECNTDFIIEVLCFITVYVSNTIHYHLIFINPELVKDILIQLQHIYDELEDKKEVAIFHKYGRIAVRYTRVSIVVLLCANIFFVGIHCGPIILDTVVPMNESRPHRLPIKVEYFVDQEEYFYLLLLHFCLATAIGTTTATLFGTSYIVCYQHICSIFRITSYRIEYVMRSNVLKNIKKNENLIYEGLTRAIHIHYKTTELSEYIISSFKVVFLLFFNIVILISSMSMFQLLQIVSHGDDTGSTILLLAFLLALFWYNFVISYIGQQVIDHNNNIFVTVYNVRWYETPLHIQKLILFLLQRGTKVFAINVSGLFQISMENFAKVMNTTISYFTVLYSVQ